MLKTAEVLSGFLWGNLMERDHFQNLGIDGRIILKGIFNKWDGGIDWINLALHGIGGGLL